MARAKTMCLYAPSGDSKTSQAVFVARYIKRKYGKRTRLVSSDGGGWAPVEDEGLIRTNSNRNGIVDVFNMTNREYYLADWRRLAKGYWPKVTLENGVPVRNFVLTTPAEWANIGCYFIEGLTSVGSGFISHISKQDNTDKDKKVMYSAPGYDEDGEHFGATDQGHVGMVQNELFNLTQQFATLPVELVVWTAHIGQTTEKSLRKMGLEISDISPTLGPQLSGNAKTAEAPSWFSDCLHLQAYTEETTVEKVGGGTTKIETKRIFAFFQKHRDELTGATYLAKSSTGPSLTPKLLRRFPGACVPLTYTKGIDLYLETLDELKAERMREQQAEIEAMEKLGGGNMGAPIVTPDVSGTPDK